MQGPSVSNRIIEINTIPANFNHTLSSLTNRICKASNQCTCFDHNICYEYYKIKSSVCNIDLTLGCTGDPPLMQISLVPISLLQISFLSKIQNLTSEKTGKKIIFLSCKKICQNTIFGSSGFSFQFLISKFQGSGFSFPFLISKIQGSGFSFPFLISKFQGSGFSFQFLKNYHDLTIFYSDFEFFSGMLLPQK